MSIREQRNLTHHINRVISIRYDMCRLIVLMTCVAVCLGAAACMNRPDVTSMEKRDNEQGHAMAVDPSGSSAFRSVHTSSPSETWVWVKPVVLTTSSEVIVAVHIVTVSDPDVVRSRTAQLYELGRLIARQGNFLQIGSGAGVVGDSVDSPSVRRERDVVYTSQGPDSTMRRVGENHWLIMLTPQASIETVLRAGSTEFQIEVDQRWQYVTDGVSVVN
ncbi:hypothetical protein LBMAG48_20830 [Phycisphaerae bacterium]|nr:hypothetical protein LBMAG48_20830 [Phycisphaerae bacterium]